MNFFILCLFITFLVIFILILFSNKYYSLLSIVEENERNIAELDSCLKYIVRTGRCPPPPPPTKETWNIYTNVCVEETKTKEKDE